MSFSYPYGNPNTSTNNPLNNTSTYNDYTYAATSRHNPADPQQQQQQQQQQQPLPQQQQQVYQIPQAHLQQPNYQQHYYQQIHPNEANRPADMNYSRYPAPFMTDRPPGPAQYPPRAQYFMPQRFPYPGGMIVEGYPTPMYPTSRPIQIIQQNGMPVPQHVNATPPTFYDGTGFQSGQQQQPQMQPGQPPFAQQAYVQQPFYMSPQQWGQTANPVGIQGQMQPQMQTRFALPQQQQQQQQQVQPPQPQQQQQPQQSDATQHQPQSQTVLQTAPVAQPAPQPQVQLPPQQQPVPQPLPIVQPIIQAPLQPQPTQTTLPEPMLLQKRVKKPLLIVNPDTNQPIDVKPTITKDTNHINESQTAASGTGGATKLFTNSYSLNHISTQQHQQQQQQVAQKPFQNHVATTTTTTTQAASVTSSTTTATTQATTVAAATGTTTAPAATQQDTTKNKQGIQNEFSISVLRRHNEIEKQKTAAQSTATTVAPVAAAATVPVPVESTPVVTTTDADATAEAVATQPARTPAAATEVPKSAVAIGPRNPTPAPASTATTTPPAQKQPAKQTEPLVAVTVAAKQTTTTAPLQEKQQQAATITTINTTANKVTNDQSKSRTNSTSSQSPTRHTTVTATVTSDVTESKVPEIAEEQQQQQQQDNENNKENIETDNVQKKKTTVDDESTATVESQVPSPSQSQSKSQSDDNKDRMRERNSYDGSTGLWTPEQQEAKKRYNRDFLLSMKDKHMATTKPRDLPIIPNVIIDEPSRPQGVRITTSMDGNYYGRGSTGRGRPGMRPSGQSGRGGGHGGGGHGGMQQRVDLPNFQDADKYLNKAEDPYKIAINDPAVSGKEKVLRQVREILNKLTPQKFQKLSNDLISLEINTEDRLKGVIDVVFEKAIDEPGFSQTYANLCRVLSTMKVLSSAGDGTTLAFRRLLLSRCQREFETDYFKEINYEELSKNVEECQDENKKKELKEDLEDKLRKAKRRSLGNIRFIGELFKLNMLSEVIMNDCINRLLKQESDEENLECLCRLLTTIGKDIDKPSNAKNMKEHFDKLVKIKNRNPPIISARIRFMILDVIELRNCEWVPRRKDNAPKTIDEIHREVEEEQLRSQQEIARLNALDANKRSSIGQGPKGKMYQQQSSLKSTSMDAEYASRTKQNMAIKIKDMKHITSNNQDIMLGPPRFSKTSSTSKPADTPLAPQTQSLRPNFSQQQSSEGEDRRGSMPSYGSGGSRGSFGGRQQPSYQQQQSSDSMRKDRKLESVRQMDRFAGNRSETSSQASSRDTSASRPSDSRDNSVTRGGDAVTPVGHVTPVTASVGDEPPATTAKTTKPKRKYTSKEVELRARDMTDEYVNNDDVTEAFKDFEDFQPVDATQYEDLARCIVQHILEKSEHARTLVGKLFYRAIKEGKFELDRFVGGMRTIFESAEDVAIDVPQLGTFLGELLAPFVQEDASIEFFKELCESIMGTSLCADFIVQLLHKASNRLGSNTVLKVFKNSNLNVNDFLSHISNLDEFLTKHNLTYLSNTTRERTQSASVSTDAYETKLYEIMNKPSVSNENVFSVIEAGGFDLQSKQFVRSLMIATCRACRSPDNKIDSELFRLRAHVLTKYIARRDDLELESLFAVQALDYQLKHPSGFIRVIFDLLYDEDTISEEAFRTWQSLDREEGHAISVLSLKAFFDWLDEAEASES